MGRIRKGGIEASHKAEEKSHMKEDESQGLSMVQSNSS